MPVFFGYIQTRGAVYPATALTVTEDVGRPRLPFAGRASTSRPTPALAPDLDLGIDVTPVAFGPVLLRDDDPAASQPRSAASPAPWSTCRTDDGRTGAGWIEWNQPDPACPAPDSGPVPPRRAGASTLFRWLGPAAIHPLPFRRRRTLPPRAALAAPGPGPRGGLRSAAVRTGDDRHDHAAFRVGHRRHQRRRTDLVTGLGGDHRLAVTTAATTTSTTASSPTTPPTSTGSASSRPTSKASQWVLKAIAAEQKLGSVRIDGKVTQGKSVILLDVLVNGDGEGGGVFIQDGTAIKVERVGTLFTSTPPRSSGRQHASAAQAKAYGGKWIALPATDTRFASFDEFLDAPDLVAVTFKGHTSPLTMGTSTTFAGHKVGDRQGRRRRRTGSAARP